MSEKKRHLYSAVQSSAALPRSDPPTVVPFPNIKSDSVSDLDLSPDKNPSKVASDEQFPDSNEQNGRENDEESFQCSLVAAPTEIAQKKKIKKAGRIVPSRYKTAASNFKKPPQSITITDDSITRQSSRPKKVTDREKLSTTVVKGPHKRTLSAMNTPFRPGPGIVTSTPAVAGNNQPHPPHKGTHEQSLSTAGVSIVHSKNPSNTAKQGKKMNRTKYLEHRLLQAAYLDIMSYKVFEEQENIAGKQLYSLWHAIEQLKKEVAELDKAIVNEETMTVLDKSLDVQLSGLSPLTAVTANSSDIHTKVATALDNTRHDVSLQNIQPFNEDELSMLLRETENFLSNTMIHVREDIPTVNTLTDTHSDLLATAEREFVEIDRACNKLSTVTKLQLKETSLFLEKMQRLAI